MRPRLVIYQSRLSRRNQRWRWKLLSENGRNVANGGEGYANKAECMEMGRRVVSGVFGDAQVEVR